MDQPEKQDEAHETKELTAAGNHKQDRSYYSRAKQAWKRTTISNKLIVALTAIIALSNFFYVLYAKRQWRVMSGQLTEMAKQYPELEKSATAARDAADAASTAIQFQAKQFKIDERPYITAEDIRIAAKPTIGQKLMAEVLWKNAGKTPALHGQIFIRIDILSHEPCCPADWERQARSGQGSTDIGSGLTRATSATGDNPLNEEWNTKLRTDRLYVFGAFIYRDIFGDRHASDFCAFYKPGSIQELFLWACHAEHTNDVK